MAQLWHPAQNPDNTVMLPVPVPHLVVPFARCGGDAWLKAIPPRGLKNLVKLLKGMRASGEDAGDAHCLSPPHERALAAAYGLTTAGGLPDGLIPWAAWEADTAGISTLTRAAGLPAHSAWAVITPCHWAMGREHATLTDPEALNLSADESQTLLRAMQPYFETGGITLHYAAPQRWLAEGEVFRHLPTASVDRVLGRNVDSWLPPSKALKLLQNEMQMLLYTHPVNDERLAKALAPVNSFWVSGTGALTQATPPVSTAVSVTRALAHAAFTADWPAYAAAWVALDAGAIAVLLDQQRSGQAVKLTLCGESGARTFETAPRHIFSQFMGHLARWPNEYGCIQL